MANPMDDFRIALRTLRRNPILTAVALLSLGFGIGANTAIFTLMDRLILRPLPVQHPGQLVLLTTTGSRNGFIETEYGNAWSFSFPKYRELRERTRGIFDGLLARFPFSVNLAANGTAEETRGELVSGSYFSVLGVRPALGRLIADDDAAVRGARPVAVLSHGYWLRRFGGQASVLNQTITVNGQPLSIVGVAQAGFQSVGFGESPAVFVPISMLSQIVPGLDVYDNPHAYWLNIFGRLRPGISIDQASAALPPIWRAVLDTDVATFPSGPRNREQYLNSKLIPTPGAGGISSVRSGFAEMLYLLMAMVGVVLLIACANVANLLLGRAAAREKELAIRVSLGAGRGRLARHVMAESLLLSLGGGVAGILMASWASSLMLHMVPDGIPIAGVTGDPDGRILLFAFAVSVLTSLLFGYLPALRATRPDLALVMKDQTARPASRSHARFRQVLVTAQIALSTLLLAAAGMCAHSLYNLSRFQPGFRSEGIATFAVHPRLSGYSRDRLLAFEDHLLRETAALPGVQAVSAARESVLTGSMDMSGMRIEGYVPPDGRNVGLSLNHVAPGFFRLLGIPLMAGRDFGPGDTANAPVVAIVNQSLARKYFEGRNPIGMHVSRRNLQAEIVGVVGDAKYDDLREEPKPFIYFAAAQDRDPGPMTFYVLTPLPVESLAPALRKTVASLDPSLPVAGPRTFRGQIMESVFLDRMIAALAAAFAGLATLLAAIGLYGVIAWAVTRRRREIGIRMAMGAKPSDVRGMVLWEVFRLTAAGMVVAIPAWFAASLWIAATMFNVKSNDPLSLAGAIALLAAVAAIAGFAPAFRASRIDPISAIRYE
jgi:putative ABC transport system permease protein